MKRLFLSAAIFLSARAAWAQSFVVVDSGVDQNVGTCATSAPCSLRAAVQTMNTNAQVCGCAIQTVGPPRPFTGNQIFINASASPSVLTGAGQENANAHGDLDLAITGGTALTIGPSDPTATVEIDAPAGDRIFDIHHTPLAVADAPIIFERLLMVGASATTANDECLLATSDAGDGGVVRIGYVGPGGCAQIGYAPTVTFTGCTVRSATSDGNGGGIATQGTALTLIDTTVQGNQASADGGGIYANTGSLTLRDGTIIGPTNTAANGGGVAAEGNALIVTSAGGAVSIDSNSATSRGGGIYVGSGTAALTSTTATPIDVSSNSAANGGGIAFSGTLLTVNGGTISANTATSGNGGGIYSAAGTSAVVVQAKASVSANTAAGSGGGIYIGNQDGTATGAACFTGAASGKLSLCLDDATVAHNQTTAGDGAGVALAPPAGATQTADIFNATIGTANAATGNGGGIFVGVCTAPNGCPTNIAQSTVIDSNTATGSGGGIYASACGTPIASSCPINFTSSTVSNNQAGAQGGGIAIFGDGNALTIASTGPAVVRSAITGNKATGSGGGIYSTAVDKQTITISACDIGVTGAGNTAAAGGGMFIDTTGNDSAVLLQNATAVTANAASSAEGGGISLNKHATGTKHPQLTLDHVNVTRNRARTNGGGLYNGGVSGHTLIAGGTFSDDTATQNGGAIYNAKDGTGASWPATTACSVLTAPSAFLVCNAHFDASVVIATVPTGNSAASGGAIANASTLALYDSIIDTNTAVTGAGIANLTNGSLYAYQTNITNNSASGNGGGVLAAGSAVFFGDLLSDNATLANGGGIYGAAGGGPLAVVYSTLFENSAHVSGGAIFTNDGQSVINNATIAFNTASTGTGAGLDGGANTDVANSIVDQNSLPGSVASDCVGATSEGSNIFGPAATCNPIAPDLGDTSVNLASTLANFGGLTDVLIIAPGSTALNSGHAAGTALPCGALGVSISPALTVPATDQRLVTPYPQGQCDRGAFESTPSNQVTIGAATTAVVAGGATVTYPVSVQNTGPDNALNLVVSFTLPAHTIYESITAPGYTCTPATGGTGPLTVTCTRGATLAPGGAADTLTIGLRADAFYPVTSPTSAWGWSVTALDATADPGGSNTAVCSAASCKVTSSVGLTLTKDDGVSTLAAGAATTYVITLSNSGPSAAIGASLADTGPTTSRAGGIASESWACVASSGSSCVAAGSGAIGSQTVTVAPAGTVTFSLVVQTKDYPALLANDTMTNTASFAASAADGSGTGTATDSDTFTGSISEVGVTKTAPAVIGEGATLTYTTTFVVEGPSATNSVTLTDISGSPATTFVSFTLDTAAAAHFTCTNVPASGTTGVTTITCVSNSTNVVPVGSYVFTTIATVLDDGSTPSPIPYSATVALDPANAPPQQDIVPNPSFPVLPDAASGSITIDIASDAAIALAAPASVVAGDTLSYTITVSDNGPSTARNLSWSMSVPASTSFVSITAPSVWTCTPPSVGGTGVVSCNAGTLPTASGPQSFALVVKVDPTTPNGATIAGSATLGTMAHDPQPANNGPATATTSVASDADLAITLAANVSEVAQGGTIDYTIDVENNGPSAATMGVVTIQLPTEATYKSIAATNLRCDTPVGGLITCTLADIAPGASETAALSVSVSASAHDGDVLTTTGTVTSASADTVPANDTASAAVTVNHDAAGTQPVTFGSVTVAHDQVHERGGFFRCDSMGGNGATDLAALLGTAFIATRARRRRR